MHKSIRLALILITLLLSGPNAAADNNLWFGVKAGTLGAGIEATWRPVNWVDLRLGGNMFDYTDNGSQAGINYDATLALETYYATINFHFPVSPFRLSVGAFSNSNRIKMISIDTTAFDIGGTTFSAAEVGTLRGEASWDSVSPYLGAGFDFKLFGKLGLTFDFGVLLQGDPKVSLTSDGTLAGDQFFIDALESERAELEEEADVLKAYPVLSLGFNFNF